MGIIGKLISGGKKLLGKAKEGIKALGKSALKLTESVAEKLCRPECENAKPLSSLTPEERLFAKIADQAYKTSRSRMIDDFELDTQL